MNTTFNFRIDNIKKQPPIFIPKPTSQEAELERRKREANKWLKRSERWAKWKTEQNKKSQAGNSSLMVLLMLTLLGGAIIAPIIISESKRAKTTVPAATFRTVVIDNCEYLETPGYHTFHYAHKGNCTNDIHIYNNH